MFNKIEDIKNVKIASFGYNVNGIFIPNDENNRHYGILKEWLKDNTPEPEFTEEEIALQKATEYQRLRKAEYSKLNQMEMMYDDKVNGTDTWGEAIQAIKEKYPKPEYSE